MSIKLIAMDLDGTLLDSKKLISQRNMEAIAAARKAGVYVTLATGRMYSAAAYFARQIEANAPVVCCNGSMVRTPGARESVFEKLYDDDVAKAVLSECYENGWYAQWYVGEEIYAESFRREMFDSYKTVKDFTIREVGKNFLPYVHDVVQIVVRDGEGRVPQIAAYLAEKYKGGLSAQQNTGYSVDLTPPGITKASGLEALRLHLGLKTEEIMVCGDADNDLAMLAYAGLSIVPENGTDEAKALADYITASCDEDGIGKAIEKFVLEV